MRMRTTIGFGMVLGALALAPAAQAKGTAYVVGGNSNAVGVHAIAENGALGAVSPVPTVQTPRSAVINPSGTFLYTTGANGDNIGIHSIDPATGALGAVGAPVAAGGDPEGPSITPNGQFLYVANTGGNSVSAYAISPETGGLTPIGGAVALANPNGTAVSPDGANLYVSTDTGTQAYRIGADGAITANGALQASGNPRGIAVTPNGQFLYVANSAGNSITGYSIAADGSLTPVGTTPGVGPTAFGLAITQDGRFLYTANFTNPGTANGFAIGNDGSLTPVPGQPFNTGSEFAYAVDAAPNGRVYVANDVQGGAPGTVGQFDRGADGALTAITGSPVTTVIAPEFQAIVVSPNQGPTALFTGGVVGSRESRGGGQTAEFNASSSSDSGGGSIASYTWDFGDGTAPETTTSPTISHNYTAEGDYQVTLTVVDDEGCSNQVLFTGQTVDCNGTGAARMTQTVQVSGGTPPNLKLKGKKQDLAKKVTVTAKTADDTEAVAKGKVRIAPKGGKAKSYKLKKATKDLDAGEKTKVKPKLSKKAYKKAKKALKNKGKVSAKVNVKVTDDNDDTDKDSVKFKLTK